MRWREFVWEVNAYFWVVDAWTELGIYGGNEWGIGASMVSAHSTLSLCAYPAITACRGD